MNAAEIHRRWMDAMRRGDFEAAWRETDAVELPRRARGGRREEAGELVWDGTPFAGRDVLVRCLHGLGDTLQFIRFVPALRASARSVVVAIQPALLPLFPPRGEFGEVRDGWTSEAFPHEVEIEVMELAYAFRATPETLPAQVPYLDVRWIEQHPQLRPPLSRKPRVGLVWAASAWDASRSIPPDALAPLAELPVEFYSLQQGADPALVPLPLRSLPRDTRPVLEAARAMLTLDLILTVDAMPAHLAGALGCPVWLLLKHEADWRWMSDRRDSPRYPTMRLFRQPTPGDWAGCIAAVMAAWPGKNTRPERQPAAMRRV